MGNFIKNRRILSGSTGAVLPGGDATVRPAAPEAGLIRYNTDSLAIEYFDGTQFVTLTNNTYGNANVALYLPTYNGNISNAAAGAGSFFADLFQGNLSNVSDTVIRSAAPDGIFFANSSIYAVTDSSLTWDGNVFLVDGTSQLGNIEIANNIITTDGTIANIVIAPVDGSDGLVILDAVTGVVLPVGNTAQRPTDATEGTLRFNSATDLTEIYTANGWTIVGSTYASISTQVIDGNGVANVFSLDQTATANSVIVVNNGIVQQPGVAYSVAGNVITFAEPPEIADVITVRFVSPVVTVNEITNDAGTSAIAVDESGVGNLSTTQSLQLPTYTVTQATALANTAPGQVIFVTDGDSGNACLAVYSSGAWRRVSLGAVIST